jgi:hypothetical protein
VAALFGAFGLFLAGGIALALYCFTNDRERPADQTSELTQLPESKGQPQTMVSPQPESAGKGITAKPNADSAPKKEPPRPALPPDVQRQVDDAVSRGTQFLASQQRPDGRWRVVGNHPIGYVALPGLTLLECGAAPNDSQVQSAAAAVRASAERLNQTYELALAILFLDKLGDAQDRETIRSMALRLVAGQNNSGGWTYHCSPGTTESQQDLLAFLREDRAYRLAHLAGKGAMANPLGLTEADLGRSASGEGDPSSRDTLSAGGKGRPAEVAEPPVVPASLRHLPIFSRQNPAKQFGRRGGFQGDHSNTQFALLGLWVARRYDIPLERTFALAELRFRRLQRPDGGWGYLANQPSTNTMTCVGLLGLAVGRGIEYELLHLDQANQGAAVKKLTTEDPGIQKGLKRLGQAIGPPTGHTSGLPMANLYFLWSVERVAVLYDLKTIGNKNWYLWGTEILLANQRDNGSWTGGQYHQANPVIDTCFALLFLKRANLVSDLSDNLRRFVPVVDPDRRSGGGGN